MSIPENAHPSRVGNVGIAWPSFPAHWTLAYCNALVEASNVGSAIDDALTLADEKAVACVKRYIDETADTLTPEARYEGVMSLICEMGEARYETLSELHDIASSILEED